MPVQTHYNQVFVVDGCLLIIKRESRFQISPNIADRPCLRSGRPPVLLLLVHEQVARAVVAGHARARAHGRPVVGAVGHVAAGPRARLEGRVSVLGDVARPRLHQRLPASLPKVLQLGYEKFLRCYPDL